MDIAPVNSHRSWELECLHLPPCKNTKRKGGMVNKPRKALGKKRKQKSREGGGGEEEEEKLTHSCFFPTAPVTPGPCPAEKEEKSKFFSTRENKLARIPFTFFFFLLLLIFLTSLSPSSFQFYPPPPTHTPSSSPLFLYLSPSLFSLSLSPSSAPSPLSLFLSHWSLSIKCPFLTRHLLLPYLFSTLNSSLHFAQHLQLLLQSSDLKYQEFKKKPQRKKWKEERSFSINVLLLHGECYRLIVNTC